MTTQAESLRAHERKLVLLGQFMLTAKPGEFDGALAGELIANVINGIPAVRAAATPPTEERVTHGRHCPCSACKRQDWTDPNLAHCGMHGPSCPPVYAPRAATPPAEGLDEDEMASVRQQERDIDRALFKAMVTGDAARSWEAVHLALVQLHQRGPGDQEDGPEDGRCTACLVLWPCPTGAILYGAR